MAESPVFDYVCEQLEERSGLDRLAVRGTVRIALKQAGLEASRVSAEQMEIVLERILPGELESRGVEGVAPLCDAVRGGLAQVQVGVVPDSPDAVFERLGG